MNDARALSPYSAELAQGIASRLALSCDEVTRRAHCQVDERGGILTDWLEDVWHSVRKGSSAPEWFRWWGR
ncbi:MAG: hypothetical protein HC933_00770 [Pleurocapsa sp. SU_196_0]|nr:hypothetical protein [Pleurocapsa sp. SU_196_0]